MLTTAKSTLDSEDRWKTISWSTKYSNTKNSASAFVFGNFRRLIASHRGDLWKWDVCCCYEWKCREGVLGVGMMMMVIVFFQFPIFILSMSFCGKKGAGEGGRSTESAPRLDEVG